MLIDIDGVMLGVRLGDGDVVVEQHEDWQIFLFTNESAIAISLITCPVPICGIVAPSHLKVIFFYIHSLLVN